MKQFKHIQLLRYSLAVATTILLSAATAQAQTVRDTIVIHDTIYLEKPQEQPADLMRVKAIGRYDRGIINHRFIPRGKWVGGVTASYVDYESTDSRILFSLMKDFDAHARTISVKPFVGYAIRNNMVIGAKMGYNHTLVQLDNLSLNMDDLDFSLHDIRFTEDSYSLGIFHRSYVGLDPGKRFGLFSETTLTYNNGSGRFTRGKESESLPEDSEASDFINTETTLHELHLGFNPGICVFIMENVAAELSFGVAGFKYRNEKQTNNKGETGKRRNSGANFKINLFNINIGITVCL